MGIEITVKVIPHDTQRYETVGDWYFDNEDHPTRLHIMVSDLGNWKYNFLVAMHEQTEAVLCLARGIKEKDVTIFDIAFEERREPGNTDEPGDDKNAPYHQEHRYATMEEKALAVELGVIWEDYENAIYALQAACS